MCPPSVTRGSHARLGSMRGLAQPPQTQLVPSCRRIEPINEPRDPQLQQKSFPDLFSQLSTVATMDSSTLGTPPIHPQMAPPRSSGTMDLRISRCGGRFNRRQRRQPSNWPTAIATSLHHSWTHLERPALRPDPCCKPWRDPQPGLRLAGVVEDLGLVLLRDWYVLFRFVSFVPKVHDEPVDLYTRLRKIIWFHLF